MTTPEDAPDLPPEQDAVRRLLAEARYDRPVPPEVAARLDAVLADLTAERTTARVAEPRDEPGTAPVVDLATRRRRGVGGAVLVAAALVVVAGVGVQQVIERSGSFDAGGDSAAGGSGESFGSADSQAEAPAEAGAGSSSPETLREDARVVSPGPAVSTDTLRRDLRVALRTAAALPTAPDAAPPCAAGPDVLGAASAVPVTLDGRPAIAVYAVPEAGRQQVDVYLCETEVPAESVSLRVR